MLQPISLKEALVKMADEETPDEIRIQYLSISLLAIATEVGCDLNKKWTLKTKSKPMPKPKPQQSRKKRKAKEKSYNR